MRTLMMAAVLALGISGAALADPMASAYGNTVTITYPNGAVAKMHIDADGTYVTKTPDGASSKGTWKIDGGNTCFSQTEPAPPAGMAANCSPTAEKKVGDSWTAPGPNGSTITVAIVAGR
ncbi:hypothetical protein [Caulobacter henricii]|uniref:Uncharacterized protein n=1 Tax=Caulobacter henricii TaxID=69395 RepID=A0A0P0NZV0_9CAUL|nr:hypothetical protein [Caulobacter henricii]ALL13525.1 hypothetical protein AQ619_09270 [Caulobacter henricii]